jgi:hypothetical protein
MKSFMEREKGFEAEFKRNQELMSGHRSPQQVVRVVGGRPRGEGRLPDSKPAVRGMLALCAAESFVPPVTRRGLRHTKRGPIYRLSTAPRAEAAGY